MASLSILGLWTLAPGCQAGKCYDRLREYKSTAIFLKQSDTADQICEWGRWERKCPGAWDWYCGRNICLLSSCLLPISYRQHVEYILSLHLFCLNDEIVVESSLPQCLMSWTSQLPDPALCWGAVLGVGGSSDSRILWGTLTRSYKDRTHHWDMGTLGLKHRNTTPGLRERNVVTTSICTCCTSHSNWHNLHDTTTQI